MPGLHSPKHRLHVSGKGCGPGSPVKLGHICEALPRGEHQLVDHLIHRLQQGQHQEVPASARPPANSRGDKVFAVLVATVRACAAPKACKH